MLGLVLAHFVDGDDIGVVEAGSGLSFEAEALHLRGGGELAGGDHFERHGPVQTYLARAIDDAHAATGQFAEDFVVAKKSSGGRRRTGVARRGPGG